MRDARFPMRHTVPHFGFPRSLALIALAAGLWVAAAMAASQGAAVAGQTSAFVDFQRQVQPILESSCSECHSQERRKGGLSLATYADILEGGRNGAVVRPGNSANSLIVHRLTGATEPQMPKDEVAARCRVNCAHQALDR